MITLKDALQLATGISDTFILDSITGILFILGFILIVHSLFKSLFRFV